MKTNREMNLPVGWTNTRLGNVLFDSDDKFDPKDGVERKYVGLEHIEKHAGVLNGHGNSGETLSTKNVFRKGDLLYGKLRPYLNKVAVVDFNGVCSTDILVFKKNDFTSNQFLKYRLLCRDFVSYAQTNVSGVQHPRVNINTIKEFSLYLPPLAEQYRIVAKIEELFSDLDAGVASLKQAQAQLKTYRQAVLKYAFEGKLTAAWRKQNKPEPAEKLLTQIKAEREKQYQQQLEEWQKAGVDNKGKKKPPKPQKPKEISPLTEAELAELPELPEGWDWVKLGEITTNFDGKRVPLSKKYRENFKGEFPYYGACEIIDYIREYLFEGEYLLIGEDGANLLSRSKPLAFTVSGKFWVNNHAHVLQSHGGNLHKFIEHQFNSLNLNQFVTGTAQPKLTQANLEKIPFRLCSILEQHQIVQEIESRLSVCDKLEESLKESLQKAEALRQSILKKAFAGKLVPQDLNDEPAEKLLARIQAEKTETPIGKE